MNYFAHGRHYIGDPYFLAGTSVPDWLSVVNRKARARSKLAEPYTTDSNPRLASIAKGIVQHHHDDGWFHGTRAFAELSLTFTVETRNRLHNDDGFRPSFLGHILVELLLDDVLIQQNPSRLDAYYEALDSLDATFVAESVNRMTTRPVQSLNQFIRLFSRERFLYDYADDCRLILRLNRVMCRVGLPELPHKIAEFLPAARNSVASRATELLTPD